MTKTFADWLKDRRADLHWSQPDLARASGFKVPLISKLENSAPGYFPRLDTFVALCNALHTSVAEPLIATGLLDRDALSVSAEEESLIQAFRALDERGRKNLTDLSKTLLRSHGTQAVNAPLVKAKPAIQRSKQKKARKK